MRDHHAAIAARGAGIAAIGMGRVEHARAFQQESGITFPLLVDRDTRTYRAMGVRRGGLNDVAGPRVWLRGAVSILKRNTQRLPQQDALQLGGTAVVATGGDLLFMHRATSSADNASVPDILTALG